MVRSNSELDRTMGELPGLESAGEPSERFDLYEVDLPTLDRLLDGAGNVRLPPQ